MVEYLFMKKENTISRRDFLQRLAGAAVYAGMTISKAERFALVRQTETVFLTEPSLDIDFSRYDDGPIPEDLFRIQTERNYDWMPEWNNEQQEYTGERENVRIENGALILQAHKERLNGQEYTSGKIDTKGIWEFQYGKLEISAKFPSGVGVFPALWLLPSEETPYSVTQDQNDPYYYEQRGEIDIAEMIGVHPTTLYTTAHTYETLSTGAEQNATSFEVEDISTAFHTYGIEKTPDSLTFTFDGIPYFRLEKTSQDPAQWPFDANWYLIMNLAMGGNWNAEAALELGLDFPHGIDDTSEDNWKFEIQNIKFFPMEEKS